ncbi:MAG: hypothetical protein CM1200mP40_24920 [Gammaproteobacteria bacterium]|nr:MAG: hypothetical protein CM1200mP40_24920 [Gammaproteobacteria bacterium]
MKSKILWVAFVGCTATAQEAASGELTDYTNVIIEEVDRLRNLVGRLVGSRKPLELKETNIHEVLEHVRSLVKARSQRKQD